MTALVPLYFYKEISLGRILAVLAVLTAAWQGGPAAGAILGASAGLSMDCLLYTSSKDANVTITPLNAGLGGNYESDALKVDDIVYYNYSKKGSPAAGVKNVVLAETVTGELTGYTSGKSVTVNGTVYKLNAAATVSSSTLSGAVKNDVTLTPVSYTHLDVYKRQGWVYA